MADSNVIDFDEIVLEWARLAAPRRLTGRTDTVYDVNWDKIRVDTGTAKHDLVHQRPVSTSVIISKSLIHNDGKNSQENEVIMEGNYTATNTVTLTKTFVIGEQTKLDLSMPNEVVKAGVDKTLSISETDKHVQTKKQTWKMTTKLTVLPKEKKTVEQTITVNEYSSTFRYVSSLSVSNHHCQRVLVHFQVCVTSLSVKSSLSTSTCPPSGTCHLSQCQTITVNEYSSTFRYVSSPSLSNHHCQPVHVHLQVCVTSLSVKPSLSTSTCPPLGTCHLSQCQIITVNQYMSTFR